MNPAIRTEKFLVALQLFLPLFGFPGEGGVSFSARNPWASTFRQHRQLLEQETKLGSDAVSEEKTWVFMLVSL
jgi:hypothetical protein